MQSKFTKIIMINLIQLRYLFIPKVKNILLKSKIAKKKQIVVNGCPRSDYSLLRKIKPKNNIIVYYLIEKRYSFIC